jgi:hypothetical protein
LFSGIVGLAIALAALTAPPAPPPPVTIGLGNREAHCVPTTTGYTHTAGGNIDVQQPSPDTVVITLTGVAVAGLHPIHNSSAQMAFEVVQGIEVSFDDPKVKRARLSIEGRVTGLLRTGKGGGAAGICQAAASVGNNANELVAVSAPSHSVCDSGNLSVNDLITCQTTPVAAGPLTIHQTFVISASHPRGLCSFKPASAEFAAEQALDPQWISYWEPFRGAAKKDFGFQIVVRVADDSGNPPANISPAISAARTKKK